MIMQLPLWFETWNGDSGFSIAGVLALKKNHSTPGARDKEPKLATGSAESAALE
jgi:hypothetical protein